MSPTHRLVIPMVPALDPNRPGSGLGDVGTVPAVRVQLGAPKHAVVVAGLIDTGAELSMLSDTIAERLYGLSGFPSVGSVPLVTGFSNVTVQLYQLDMQILGSAPGSGIAFESVPVAVGPLSHPPLILGRRGLLERLRLDLDFPRRRLTISLPRTSSAKYPNLAEMCPSLPSILTSIEEGRVAEAVMALAWDVERLADRMLPGSSLQMGAAADGSRRATLGDKLMSLAGAQPEATFLKAVQLFVTTRNRAAHGDWHNWKGDASAILASAEQIVSRMSGLTLHAPDGARRL